MENEQTSDRKLSFKDFASYEKNPSLGKKLKSIGIGDIEIDGGGLSIVDEDDGSIYKHFRVIGKKSKTVLDRKQFTKVYNDSFPHIGELSNSGVKMLVYIWGILTPDSDVFIMDVADAMKKCGYSKVTSIYTGLIDLLGRKLIYRSVGSHKYFVNVEMFFNGSRKNLEPLQRLQDKLDGKITD